LTDNLQAHPADVLAQQLDRVTGLVRTLGDLFSPQQESFATGNSFIAHGLVAVSTLLNDAQEALENLHQVCDLRLTETPVQTATPEMQQMREDVEPTFDEPMVFPPTAPEWEDPKEHVLEFQAEMPTAPAAQVQIVQDDEFAQSYLELLRKLTAAEVFAAEQQALAPPGSGQNLLPLLRSLREEFQKLHKVA
jgi:hypothetical protein